MDTHDSTEWPSGLRIIATKLAQRAAGVFLEGLIKRDQDDQDIPYLRYLAHIREHGDCAELAEQTKALLAGGSTTEEDVAARCVRIESMVSPIESRELQGGDRALLTMVLDSGAPFFDLPMQPGLSQTDLSWPNRRAYSRGRFSEEPGHATPRPS